MIDFYNYTGATSTKQRVGGTNGTKTVDDKIINDIRLNPRSKSAKRDLQHRVGHKKPVVEISSKTGGKAIGAAADLFARAVSAANKMAADSRQRAGLEGLAPILEKSLRQSHELGALIKIRTMEWDQPNFNGDRAQTAKPPLVMGYGQSPAAVMANWNARDQISAGAPKGWHMKVSYVWAVVAD